MFVTALLLGLVGVFCILDSRILGRMNFERPLITCTIVGALLGDLQTGLTLGASIELMSLGIVNIGAAAPPDMNMAAIICAAFAILTDASAETALALAIPIAVLGQMLGVLMRTILSNLTHVADHAIAEGKFRKAWSMHIVWGTVLYSLMYFIQNITTRTAVKTFCWKTASPSRRATSSAPTKKPSGKPLSPTTLCAVRRC